MKILLVDLCSILLLLAILSGCTNHIAAISSNTNETKAVAESVSYPTPAATLPELIFGLSSDDPMVRVVSADALGKYGDKAVSAVPQLKDNLYFDNSSEVRRSAVIALGRLGPLAQVVVPDLIFVIENDTATGVVLPAIESLGETGDASSVSHLAAALYCESNFYRERSYSEEGCRVLAIASAESISKLIGEHFVDAGTGIYILDEDGIPRIVVDARKWWEEEGQFKDWDDNQ
jgi:HEAT repeat protein